MTDVARVPDAAGAARPSPPASFNFVADVLAPRTRSTPERVAVIGVDPSGVTERWTYARVVEATGRLAGALIEAGIVKGDRILVFMPRTPLWLIAMTACTAGVSLGVSCCSLVTGNDIKPASTEEMILL